MTYYLEKNGWRKTDQGNYIDTTMKCHYICHPKIAHRVQRMRDHKKIKGCAILRWWKKLRKA